MFPLDPQPVYNPSVFLTRLICSCQVGVRLEWRFVCMDQLICDGILLTSKLQKMYNFDLKIAAAVFFSWK